MAYHHGDVLHLGTGGLQAGGQRTPVGFLRPAVQTYTNERQGLALDSGTLYRFDGCIFWPGILQRVASQLIPILAPHPLVPARLSAQGLLPRGFRAYSMGMPLAGKWWVAVVFFVAGWLLNIFGEEFWFRGYILPRQELVPWEGGRGSPTA